MKNSNLDQKVISSKR